MKKANLEMSHCHRQCNSIYVTSLKLQNNRDGNKSVVTRCGGAGGCREVCMWLQRGSTGDVLGDGIVGIVAAVTAP